MPTEREIEAASPAVCGELAKSGDVFCDEYDRRGSCTACIRIARATLEAAEHARAEEHAEERAARLKFLSAGD